MESNLSSLRHLSDEARIWIYGFERELDENARSIISRGLDQFLPQWMSHGVPVQGGYAILDSRFVVLAGECPGGISGCSTDSSVRNFKHFRDEYGLNGLDGSLVYFRDSSGTIQAEDHLRFLERVSTGGISPETPVFDPLLQSLGDLRAGRFEVPYRLCWHVRAFPLPDASPVGGRTLQG